MTRFFHELGVFYFRSGETKGTRQAVRNAVEAWPDIRIELIDDPELAGPMFGH